MSNAETLKRLQHLGFVGEMRDTVAKRTLEPTESTDESALFACTAAKDDEEEGEALALSATVTPVGISTSVAADAAAIDASDVFEKPHPATTGKSGINEGDTALGETGWIRLYATIRSMLLRQNLAHSMVPL
jgi:hypothetical protein